MSSGMMRKKENMTICSAIPAFIPRQLALEVLHNHSEVITLNPLVIDHKLIRAPDEAAADELNSTWYEITERIQYIPGLGKMGSGKINFNGCFHDVPWGLQTHIYAPMSVDMRAQYRIAGNQPGEEPEAKEIGLNAVGAPTEGLYLRADIEFACNITLAPFVRSQSKSAIQEMVKRMVKRAEQLDADVLNRMFVSEKISACPSEPQIQPDATDAQKRYLYNTAVPNLAQQRQSVVGQPPQPQQQNSYGNQHPQTHQRESYSSQYSSIQQANPYDDNSQQRQQTYSSDISMPTPQRPYNNSNNLTQSQGEPQYGDQRRSSYNPPTSQTQQNLSTNNTYSSHPLPSQRASFQANTGTPPPNSQYSGYSHSNTDPTSARSGSSYSNSNGNSTSSNTTETGPLPSQRRSPYRELTQTHTQTQTQTSTVQQQQQQQPQPQLQSETQQPYSYPTKMDPPPPPPPSTSTQPYSGGSYPYPYPYPYPDPYSNSNSNSNKNSNSKSFAVELPADEIRPSPLRVQKQTQN